MKSAEQTGRDFRQGYVFRLALHIWGDAAGVPKERALRLVEEALEAAQAVGVYPTQAHDLVHRVFYRPPGDIAQEIGGVGCCLLALAESVGLSADEAEVTELQRVKAASAENLRAKHIAKEQAGLTAKERPELSQLIEQAKIAVAAMTPEEREAMWIAQRESWVKQDSD